MPIIAGEGKESVKSPLGSQAIQHQRRSLDHTPKRGGLGFAPNAQRQRIHELSDTVHQIDRSVHLPDAFDVNLRDAQVGGQTPTAASAPVRPAPGSSGEFGVILKRRLLADDDQGIDIAAKPCRPAFRHHGHADPPTKLTSTTLDRPGRRSYPSPCPSPAPAAALKARTRIPRIAWTRTSDLADQG
jgi:hypothetical protein